MDQGVTVSAKTTLPTKVLDEVMVMYEDKKTGALDTQGKKIQNSPPLQEVCTVQLGLGLGGCSRQNLAELLVSSPSWN